MVSANPIRHSTTHVHCRQVCSFQEGVIMSKKQSLRARILASLNGLRPVLTENTGEKQSRWWRISRARKIFWVCTFAVVVGAGVYLRAEIHRRVARFSSDSPTTISRDGGTLLIVGGGQLADGIRLRFVELAGGRQARIVVIPAAVVDENICNQYRDSWKHFDVESVDVLNGNSRAQSDDPAFSTVLETATGVWLGGGTQSSLAAWYGQTLVESRLKDLLSRNGVIGGTSAGAAIMSSVMIAGGREKPTIGRGFDLIPGAIIDQHFVKRNRIRRLQGALERYPELIGFGIDEGAAVQYGVGSGRFMVIGQSCVIACVPKIGDDQKVNFHFEFFNPGDDFDVERLRRGDPVPPSYIDIDSILLGE